MPVKFADLAKKAKDLFKDDFGKLLHGTPARCFFFFFVFLELFFLRLVEHLSVRRARLPLEMSCRLAVLSAVLFCLGCGSVWDSSKRVDART